MGSSSHLVVVGLYRYTRNPMYVAVTLILLGWALGFGVPGQFVYAVVVAVAFHLRVVLGEEPWLARTYGATVGALFKSHSSLVLVNAMYKAVPDPFVEWPHNGGASLRAAHVKGYLVAKYKLD